MRFDVDQVGVVTVITPRRERDDEANHLVAIKAEVTRRLAGGRRLIVLDMNEIDFLNSTAIGAIVGSAGALQQKQGVLVLCGLGLRMIETLQVIGVLRRLIFRMERKEAVAAIARFAGTDAALQQLLRDNPTVDRVRELWKKKMEKGDANGLNRTLMEATVGTSGPPSPSSAPPLPPAGAPGSAAARTAGAAGIPPPPPGKKGAQEWYEAMRLLATAKQLARRAGFSFRAEMSFQEYLSELADHLSET